MKQGKIEIKFDFEKLEAIKYYLDEKGSSMETEIETVMQEFYEKTVPAQVRSFIERRPVTEGKKIRRKSDSNMVLHASKDTTPQEDGNL